MSEAVLADLEVERKFLSTLADHGMLNPVDARQLLDRTLVVPERMFNPLHRETLRAIVDLLREGKPTDVISVARELPEGRRDAVYSLLDTSQNLCSVQSLPAYGDMICKLALRRKLATIAAELRAQAHDLSLDVGDVLAQNTKALSGITIGRRERKTALDAIDECFSDMQDVECGRASPIIPTGLIALDNIIAGLAPTLHVIGAAPGTGKSAVLASIATNIAKRGLRIGVFSLEDAHKWIAWRVIANEARVPQMILRTRPMDKFQKKRVLDSVPRLRSFAENIIIETKTKTPREICQSMRDMVLNDGVSVLALDHLGEVRYEGGSKERHDLLVGGAVMDFRDVANDLQVPVIVFSQLARRQGRTDTDIPQKSDFKNSGDIEASARVLLGLARGQGSDVLRIGVIKSTNGMVGECEAKFIGLSGMVRDCEGARVQDLYSQQGEEAVAHEGAQDQDPYSDQRGGA